MKISKLYFTLFLGLGLATSASAQYEDRIPAGAYGYYEQALRLSRTGFGGSARMQGVGGANTAVGGDISSAFRNPAGLGMLRRSEFTFSPGFGVIGRNTEVDPSGETFDETKLNLNLAHAGAAFFLPTDGRGAYRGGALAITFGRMSNFQQRYLYEYDNNQNTISDFFAAQANQSLDNVYGQLAFDTYLVNPIENELGSVNYEPIFRGPVRQVQRVDERGAQNQWNISYGGNILDKFFFGAGLGIQTFNYTREASFAERAVGPDYFFGDEPLNNFNLNETRRLDGAGINASAGVLYRPFYALRLGASIVSPTVIRVTETYDASLTVDYNDFVFEEANGETFVLDERMAEIETIENKFTLLTPLRATLGAAVFLGSHGFISAEAEYVDYGAADFISNPQGFSLDQDNQAIDNLYGQSWNFRGGAEARLGDFRLRGGAAYFGDPYDKTFESDEAPDFSQLAISGGLGYHPEPWYFDFSLTRRSLGDPRSETPYSLAGTPAEFGDPPRAIIDGQQWNAVITAGFHF